MFRNLIPHLRLYGVHEGIITVPLNITVFGDFCITLFHARNALKGMGRPQGIKICQFQMHTGYVSEQETLIRLDKSELDDISDGEHIPGNFSISIPILVGSEKRTVNAPWKPFKIQPDPATLFGSTLEYDENVDNFGRFYLSLAF